MTIAQPVQAVHSGSVAPANPEPVAEKPKLTLVPAPEQSPGIQEILQVYKTQKRECWLCEKIAGALLSGKEANEDEKWHFTTCVLSWENLGQPAR